MRGQTASISKAIELVQSQYRAPALPQVAVLVPALPGSEPAWHLS